ncbi:MAG: prolyl-tRNA synthetase associated domain-containing protein [Clostridia bacterium]
MIHPEEQPVMEALAELGIHYTRYEHGRALTMEDCESIGADVGAQHVKNLFLTNRQGTDFYLLLLCAQKKFRTAEVSKQLGVSRLSFCTQEQLMDKLKLVPGSVTAMALVNDTRHEITVVVDEDVKGLAMLCVHPCTSEVSYAISGEDLFKFLAWRTNELRFVHIDDDA